MELKNILRQVKDGSTELENAESQIRSMGYVPVSDIAKLDTFRKCRTGFMEAILAEGKEADDIIEIVKAHKRATGRTLITRINEVQASALRKAFVPENIEWGIHSRTAVVHDGTPVSKTGGTVAIISAGTADIDVAEEARMAASEMGCNTIKIYDVGVAGFHRLISEMKSFEKNRPDAIVVAAGREGTLPTVVSSLIDVPVIGLPVSTGYGAGAKGEAALLSMLQSCSILSVVNIDAGFVAGAFAARIANSIAEARK
ncbi:nickel pincer cofactor biosynthesis protein LarB [Methanococcoides burtonii]|uniref:Phosphoribosylaminoimidazole carboxylase catalytic subunit n=1 Tax=Methanococcoides burtonii (strain DSM 6242 / NBRC 107633 / OCM 468 / ACE-M) TaxID=259564 RepID=Q12TU9_METBU|nr:nickel pincer cofactor biosynthesis protein LarB [Methanococcoides burtonii]ABE53127.1 Phosphoribosylaminoimidazole carboxylase catalytic subunit [Methanococcoides burtonii DSM 6242]